MMYRVMKHNNSSLDKAKAFFFTKQDAEDYIDYLKTIKDIDIEYYVDEINLFHE